jgi:DNA-directed RNA polymerase specialized sigma24 family protein
MLRDYGVHTLSPKDRTLFIKRYIEGYTLAELTTRWMSEVAVRKRLATIVQRLQRYRKDA